ncbi:ABC transporter permease [Paenibacillus tarimensis]
MNRRSRTLLYTAVSLVLLLIPLIGGWLLGDYNLATRLEARNLAPSPEHPFGTDWLGRDMLTRTLKGLVLSLGVGLTAALASAVIAGALGLTAAALGGFVDRVVTWLVDLFLSIPHIVILILLAFVFGGGVKGVILAVALTHWPSLTRVIRAEVLHLKTSEFVMVSRHIGKSRWWVASRHYIPHLLPQFIVGTLLLFPHAILHEAAITFLGMGLSPHQPAIGIILSESMRYLSTGMWWLAFFPGLCLLVIVRAFDVVSENVYSLIHPHRSNE